MILMHFVKGFFFLIRHFCLRKLKKQFFFSFWFLICFSILTFTLTTEITESNPETTGWMLNAVCVCHPCLSEGVAVFFFFFLKQYVTLGFILWLSKLGSKFSWDNDSHSNPQFCKARENFKRKVTDERDPSLPHMYTLTWFCLSATF